MQLHLFVLHWVPGEHVQRVVAITGQHHKLVLALPVEWTGKEDMDVHVLLVRGCAENEFALLLENAVAGSDFGLAVRRSIG